MQSNQMFHTSIPDFRSTNSSPTQLFSTLMILKAACMHNQCYIDRLITTFMKVLHKMAKEHLQPTTTETSPSKQWKSYPTTIKNSRIIENVSLYCVPVLSVLWFPPYIYSGQWTVDPKSGPGEEQGRSDVPWDEEEFHWSDLGGTDREDLWP